MPIVNGTLTDFGLDPLAASAPHLVFMPASPGIAGMNVLSSKEVEAVPAANGYFEVDLASTQTIAPATHYVIQIRWTETKPSRKYRSETLPWKLFVPPEGGALGDLLKVPSNPALAHTGTEAPYNPSPGTWWLNPETGDLTELSQNGTSWNHKANLRGPAGYMATGAAEDAAALAAFAKQTAGPNAFAAALDDELLALHGKSKGGAITHSRRKPTLHIEREWPNTRSDYKVLWAQGSTAYGEGRDGTLYKTTDGGRNWAARTFNYTLSNYRGMFLKLASGAILQVRNNNPLQFFRSTDDGATWTAGTVCRASGIFLTGQSWAQDPVTGYIYAVEYHTSDLTFADVRVYRSTDDGVTFSVWYTFPGPTSSDPNKIRHGHSVQWDSVSQRIYVSMGDADDAAGIYRVTADGSTLEPVVTRAMLAAAGIVSATSNLARAIGIMWFPQYIAWGVDEADGEVVRMKRTEIGKPAPVIERGLGLTSGGWGCTKASADGSVWVTFGSAEQAGGIALDRAMHVYAVSDNGARVIELGSIPAAGQDFAAPAAIGQAELHTDVLWFCTRGMDVGTVDRYYKAQLGVGEVQIGSTNSAQPLWYGAPDNISGRGPVGIYSTATPNGYTIGYTRAPLTARRLYITNAGVHSFSGTCRVRVYRKDTNAVLFSTTAKNARGGITRQEASEYLYSVQLPGDTDVEVRIEDNTGTAAGEASAYVTLAWGL